MCVVTQDKSRHFGAQIQKNPPRTRQRTLILAAFLPLGRFDDTRSRGGPAPSIHVSPRARSCESVHHGTRRRRQGFTPSLSCEDRNSPASHKHPHAQRTHHDRYTRLRTDQAPATHGEQTYPETMSDIIIPGHRLTGAGTRTGPSRSASPRPSPLH